MEGAGGSVKYRAADIEHRPDTPGKCVYCTSPVRSPYAFCDPCQDVIEGDYTEAPPVFTHQRTNEVFIIAQADTV